MSTLQTVIARGASASRPSATATPIGALYYSTDTGVIERNNGTTWDAFSTAGGSTAVSLGAVGLNLMGVPGDDGTTDPPYWLSALPMPSPPGVATQFLNGTGVYSTPSGSAGPWVLAGTNSPTTQTVVDFTGLAGATDIKILVRAMTKSNSGIIGVQVSVDNGANFLSASGDYVAFSGTNGTETNHTEMALYITAATLARGGLIELSGCNLTSPKTARSNFFSTDSLFVHVIPTASAINAVRVMSTGGGTMSAGTIWVYTR